MLINVSLTKTYISNLCMYYFIGSHVNKLGSGNVLFILLNFIYACIVVSLTVLFFIYFIDFNDNRIALRIFYTIYTARLGECIYCL